MALDLGPILFVVGLHLTVRGRGLDLRMGARPKVWSKFGVGMRGRYEVGLGFV